MKKLIPFLVLLVGATGALAQGVVNFNNNVLATPPDRRVINGATGEGLTGTNWVAQLYYGTSADSLTAHTAAPSRFRVESTSQPGMWSGGNRTLTGGGVGTTLFMQVRVWDLRNGATYETATGFRGQSTVFTYMQTLSTPAAPTDTQMLNFQSFIVPVPEPSVIGLGLVGAGALFMLRRRK
jgi:hypothetical protein